MTTRLLEPGLRVDRVLIAACDAATWKDSLGAAYRTPLAAQDVAVVEQAWHEAGGWQGASERLQTWARAAAALWTRELERAVEPETIPSLARAHQDSLDWAQSALTDLGADGLRGLWAVAELVAVSSMLNHRDRWGLSAALTEACPSGPEAWPLPGESDVVDRPLRFEMESGREASDLCLCSLSGPSEEGWDAYVDPYELPLPLELADAYADLAARQAEISHEGFYPAEFNAEFEQIDREESALVPRMRAALGSAYRISLGRGNFRRRSRL